MNQIPIPIDREDRPTVLLIDDESANRQTFAACFRRDFNVLLAADLNQAWSLLEHHHIHVVICDQRMPEVLGCEALRRIRERYPQVRRMLITAYADLQAVVDALNQAGVCHYIQKPWEVEDVLAAVGRAYAEYVAESERSAYTERLLEANQQLEFALRQRLLS